MLVHLDRFAANHGSGVPATWQPPAGGISHRRRPRPNLGPAAACAFLSVALAACAVAPATATPGATGTAPGPTAPPSVASPTVATPAPTESPSPTSSATPAPTEASAVPSPTASPPAAPAFVTLAPPDPQAAWSGISWRKLASDDQLAHVRTMTRWHGGLIAVGAPAANGETSSTPVWVSTDGAAWRALDPAVFGPATVVVGMGPTAQGLVAVTLQGGKNDCSGEEQLVCWTLAGPLQAWTSSNGFDWTAHPGPGIAPRPMFEGGGLEVPIVRAGKPGVLVMSLTAAGLRAAISADGIAWDLVPPGHLPAHLEVGAVEASGSGFVLVGNDGGDPGRAIALSSPDGRTWQRHDLPTPGLDPHSGSAASRLAVGPDGLVARGEDQLTPGTAMWWSSLDGEAWREVSGYPPLGTWTGEGEGSGLIENGTLAGSGERMLAYRTDPSQSAWTSLDGRAWAPLTITGSRPTGGSDPVHPDLVLLPIGVLYLGTDGAAWLGEPVTH